MHAHGFPFWCIEKRHDKNSDTRFSLFHFVFLLFGMDREDGLSEAAACPATQPGRLVSADLRGFSHNAVFQLDGIIKTMQCDADATEVSLFL